MRAVKTQKKGEPDFGTDCNDYGCFVPDLTRFAAQCMRRGPPSTSVTEDAPLVSALCAVISGVEDWVGMQVFSLGTVIKDTKFMTLPAFEVN